MFFVWGEGCCNRQVIVQRALAAKSLADGPGPQRVGLRPLPGRRCGTSPYGGVLITKSMRCSEAVYWQAKAGFSVGEDGEDIE